MRFVVDKDKAGEFRWYVKAANGEIIGASLEGFKRRIDCETNAELVGAVLHDAISGF